MEHEFENLKLKPITEGLGLNHFADGLPYAPASQTRRPMVQFNFPPPRSARLEAAPAELLQEPTSTDTAEDISEAFDLMPGNLAARGFAYFLDTCIAISLFTGIVWGSFAFNGYDVGKMLLRDSNSSQIWLPLVLLYAVVHVGYFLIQETTWRTTVGKALLGLRIHSSSGFSTIGRALLFFVSTLPFGIGLIWGLFDSERRCWHDLITDSRVVAS